MIRWVDRRSFRVTIGNIGVVPRVEGGTKAFFQLSSFVPRITTQSVACDRPLVVYLSLIDTEPSRVADRLEANARATPCYYGGSGLVVTVYESGECMEALITPK
jgi:hypothetical protein